MLLVYFISLFSFFFQSLWTESKDNLLIEANQAYQQGLQATTFDLREQAFNRALNYYYQAAKNNRYASNLNRAIGDTYFQLEQYPWAILYYQRALSNHHDSLPVLNQLEKSHQMLDAPFSSLNFLPNSSPIPTVSDKFLFWSILITFMILSAVIWQNNCPIPKLHYGALFASMVIFLLLGNITISYYLTPIEAIVVSSTGLYRAPNSKQSQLLKEPLWAGSKVQVLQSTSDGDWIKIILPSGLVGYVPFDKIRII